MHSRWLGFIEMFVVLAFALGWGVVELVALRLDKERDARRAQCETRDPPAPPE